MSDDLASLEQFNGIARLFPLPNLVLFPQVIQPLHIFEPRYRQLTAHALAGDRLLAMVLLRPGWDDDYEGRPPIHSVACLGRIIADQRLDDGRYNLLLRGLQRVRILEEMADANLYRSARVELVAEDMVIEEALAEQLRQRLRKQVPVWFPAQTAVIEQFHKLLEGALPLGSLCDILSYALPLSHAFKQELLEIASAEARVRRLLQHLAAHSPPQAGSASERPFPPDFSDN